MKTPLNLVHNQTIRGTSSSKSNYMFSSAERQIKGSSSRYRYDSREEEDEEVSSEADVQRVVVKVNPDQYILKDTYPRVQIDISSDNESEN